MEPINSLQMYLGQQNPATYSNLQSEEGGGEHRCW